VIKPITMIKVATNIIGIMAFLIAFYIGYRLAFYGFDKLALSLTFNACFLCLIAAFIELVDGMYNEK